VNTAADEERLLLDVREPEEFVGALGHVPGAVLIPLGELPTRLDEIKSYKNKKVVAISNRATAPPKPPKF